MIARINKEYRGMKKEQVLPSEVHELFKNKKFQITKVNVAGVDMFEYTPSRTGEKVRIHKINHYISLPEELEKTYSSKRLVGGGNSIFLMKAFQYKKALTTNLIKFNESDPKNTYAATRLFNSSFVSISNDFLAKFNGKKITANTGYFTKSNGEISQIIKLQGEKRINPKKLTIEQRLFEFGNMHISLNPNKNLSRVQLPNTCFDLYPELPDSYKIVNTKDSVYLLPLTEHI